ncbi:MAG: tubulin/FtsZ family protein [Methanoregula sp.]
MRILAIGLGGAGCRIVSHLYSTDRHSSKVACVKALAVDVDSDTLAQLADLPENAKIFFPALEPEVSGISTGLPHTATIDINEIIARIQNIESGETDAIFICCGLGGSMVDVAPQVITALRASVVEPIFGLITLPCLSEGEKRSAKAADDIDMLSPLLDGMILFDNETWSKKMKGLAIPLIKKDTGFAGLFGAKKSRKTVSPIHPTFAALNLAIVKRISLILRAGEFKADGGIELAEVVMDSGEVLNTMQGMGFITIGYAVEHLPHHPLGFLSHLGPIGFFADEHKKRDSRIVELAKQAIYNEISTPCDMTSAAKALILIAGPSRELSMKGFMTVRKWIDRSIAGLETRSGDYPVTNTKYVAIIVMLAGLENIPRLAELKEIREQYISGRKRQVLREAGIDPGAGRYADGQDRLPPYSGSGQSGKRDEMIVLPGKKQGDERRVTGRSPEALSPSDQRTVRQVQPVVPDEQDRLPEDQSPTATSPKYDISGKEKSTQKTTVSPPEDRSVTSSGQESRTIQQPFDQTKMPSRHIIIRREHDLAEREPDSPSGSIKDTPGVKDESGVHRVSPKQKPELTNVYSPQGKEDILKTKDLNRQRIENELQRQRMMAILGKPHKAQTVPPTQPQPTPLSVQTKTIIHRVSRSVGNQEPTGQKEIDHPAETQSRVLIKPKKHLEGPEEIPDNKQDEKQPAEPEIHRKTVMPQSDRGDTIQEESQIEMKRMIQRSKDDIFDGKEIASKDSSKVNDDALLHTRLKLKKKQVDSEKSLDHNEP